jgi:hypothetical protein
MKNQNPNKEEKSIFERFDRYTVKPWFFQRDNEILYLYRNFLFNERFNDRLNLDYDFEASKENLQNEGLNVYPEIPKKLNFFKILKYRKAIRNFIIYQQSIKANTFVERKILKESKNDLVYIYEKTQLTVFYSVSLFHVLLFRNKISLGVLLISAYLNFSRNYLGDFLFMLNFNEMLMKFQINPYYKLGRETKDFVNYLENNLRFEGAEIISKSSREKKYFYKFFVNDIFDIKFEPEDIFFDYLANTKSNYDFHQEYLKKLEMETQNKIKY